VDFSAEDKIFHGRLCGINDIISFEGHSVEELEQDFKEAVEDYFETCAGMDKQPQKPFSGRFVVRIPSELHSRIALKARQAKSSINNLVTEALQQSFSI